MKKRLLWSVPLALAIGGSVGFAIGQLTGLIICALIGLIVALWSPFWQRRKWQSRVKAIRTIPTHWHGILSRKVTWYEDLQADEQQRFRAMAAVFLAEIPIRGVGCELTEEDRLLVAAGAIIPVFGFPFFEYERLNQVLIRPQAFDPQFGAEGNPLGVQAASGMVGDGGLFDGTLMLSLYDLRQGFSIDRDGHNVAIHEFAHLVDKAGGGSVDGLPAGLTVNSVKPWVALVKDELAKGGRRRSAILTAYGYTNPQEFFAVASEYFFERPKTMEMKKPELYQLMTKIYGGQQGKQPEILPPNPPKP